jgi:hypothetical protein
VIPELIVETLEWRPTGTGQAFVLDLPRFFRSVLDLL